MNVFEHAMKMEQDGRDYYLDMAGKAESPALERILKELADDELGHYNTFKALRDRQLREEDLSFGTTIVGTIKNVFDTLKEGGGTITATDLGPVDVWEHALQVEQEAEKFYREKAGEVDGDQKKKVLTMIADEEHRHYVAIDSVISFLRAPQQWLEDAEWNNINE